jgi:hypothetical protein
MGTQRVTLEVLNPRGNVPKIPQISLSRRLNTLRSRDIGILDNGKVGGGMLLPYLEEALKRRVPDIVLRTWTVPFAQPVDSKEPILREIAECSDGIIALIGD